MRALRITSILILLGSLAVAFWPVVQSARFWVSVGIIVGIVGTFITSIAIAQQSKDSDSII